MNDLAFVMCNLKLTRKQKSRAFNYDYDDICSDDEWITEGRIDGDDVEEEDDEVLQPHEIDENMANPLFSVDLNADFNIEDVRTNYNDTDDAGDTNGDHNGEGEEFEDNGDNDNPTFDDLC
ncbi:hypothetical protein QN277_006079 [Acacia crassicarpa]|uniref:Uncharacterized protein n=1 Tax=Acacia crassicarpa TaxID=499986 RepID=A0AAE1J113_9FABA|nr:hypothetical protein QN277_006079 [Acacia crassicarpa]